MKTAAALTLTDGIPHVAVHLLLCAWLTGAGCVSQSAYEQTKAETDEVTRTLEVTRGEVTELEQRVTTLQEANRETDAVTTELRTAIQREQDSLPVLRQRADDKLAALQAQVARLINQNRQLARQMADAKQESASLQAAVTQYKQELAEARPAPPPPAPVVTPAPAPPVTQPAVVPPAMPVSPAPAPQQMAQAAPVDPLKAGAPASLPKAEPEEADQSWTGMIKSWVHSLWSWIFD